MKSSKVPLFISITAILFVTVQSNVGHAPPGVNPAVYDNVQYQHAGGMPQGQQQYMAQPGMQPQYMAQPQQYQGQVPHAQYGGQQQYQQPPPQHHAPHPGQPVLHTNNIQQEKKHISEHMDVPLDTSKMSEQELQFHYFKMHDSDNNNKLDGSELIKSLLHWHEQGHGEPGAPPPEAPKLFSDEELSNLIDPILKTDDTNQDGYIDYTEFVYAQKKAATTTK